MTNIYNGINWIYWIDGYSTDKYLFQEIKGKVIEYLLNENISKDFEYNICLINNSSKKDKILIL